MAGAGLAASEDDLNTTIDTYAKDSRIDIASTSEGVTLTYGKLLISKLEFV
jgi:hypothetical protein